MFSTTPKAKDRSDRLHFPDQRKVEELELKKENERLKELCRKLNDENKKLAAKYKEASETCANNNAIIACLTEDKLTLINRYNALIDDYRNSKKSEANGAPSPSEEVKNRTEPLTLLNAKALLRDAESQYIRRAQDSHAIGTDSMNYSVEKVIDKVDPLLVIIREKAGEEIYQAMFDTKERMLRNSIRDINLWNKKITDIGAKIIGYCIKQAYDLTYLNLGYCGIKESGMIILGRELKDHPSLRDFILGCTTES